MPMVSLNLSSLHRRLLGASLLVVTSLAPAGCVVKPQVIETSSPQRAQEDLVVVGYAEVEVVPDQAHLRIGVKERNENPVVVMQAVEQKVQKMLATLRAQGIPNDKIKTDDLMLYQRYEGRDPQDRFRELTEQERVSAAKTPPKSYYEGVYTVKVEVDDLSKVGALVNTVQTDGANFLSSIEFGMKEPEVYVNQARAKAVENAMAQAKVLAQSSGRKLGEIIQVATIWGDREMYGVPGGLVGGRMSDLSEGMRIPILPGTVSFDRQVRVSFALE